MQSAIIFLKALINPEFVPIAVRVAAVAGTAWFVTHPGSAVVKG